MTLLKLAIDDSYIGFMDEQSEEGRKATGSNHGRGGRLLLVVGILLSRHGILIRVLGEWQLTTM